MKQALRSTWELQNLNRRIHQLKQDRDRLRLDTEGEERVVGQKQERIEEVHGRRMQAAKHADAAQLRIEEAEGEIERYRLQLNTVKHQNEYDAIQRAVASRQADIQKWEDEALEALQEADGHGEEETRLIEQVQEGQARLADLRAEADRQARVYASQIESLAAQRDELRSSINPDVLDAYDRQAARHPHTALAEVRDRVCLGCYTQITKQTENLLLRGDKLVHCHSCGRMLLLAPGESA
jgi:predicted  nucleic acid-binding Zn-ribbon protein